MRNSHRILSFRTLMQSARRGTQKLNRTTLGEGSSMQHRKQWFAFQFGAAQRRMGQAGILAILLLLLAGTATAQVSTASVNGVIRDPKGAVIPGATIVLHSMETSID